MTDQVEEQVAQMKLAQDIIDFLATELGQVIQARAQGISERATTALKTCKPEELQYYQNIIWKADTFLDWLQEGQVMGDIAYQNYQIMTQENEDG